MSNEIRPGEIGKTPDAPLAPPQDRADQSVDATRPTVGPPPSRGLGTPPLPPGKKRNANGATLSAAQRRAETKARKGEEKARRQAIKDGVWNARQKADRRNAKARERRQTRTTAAKLKAASAGRAHNSIYRDEFPEIVRNLCVLGLTDDQIAESFGVSPRTIDNWKRSKPAFLVAMRAGKVIADAQVAGATFKRAIGYSHPAVKIFLREKDEEPVIVPYTQHYAPDTVAAKFWLMNRQRHLWKERQEIATSDPLASMTPEARLAQVVDIMTRARALLDATPDEDDEIADAEYEDAKE